VVERKNMINDYLRGRACIEFVRWSLIQGELLSLSFSCSFCFGFELFLALLCHFDLFAAFLALCWPCSFFFLLDNLVELFLAFWSSSCAYMGS
jgi:hypothetical protein